MQQSVVPELAHTQTSPIQWVATATAIAGVVALSSLVQPDPARAAQPGAGPSAATAPAAPAAAPTRPASTSRSSAAPSRSSSRRRPPETWTATAARRPWPSSAATAGSGTPPSGVYVLTQAEGAQRPRVVATLIDPKDRLSVTDFAVSDGDVTATLLGYSSADVPSCCPDLRQNAKWQWKNGAFIRSTPSEARGA